MPGLQAAEWINLVYFTGFVLLALLRSLRPGNRQRVVVLGSLGIGATLAALAGPTWLRHWLPAALMLLAYQQAGQFFVRADERLQLRLEALDERRVAPVLNLLRTHAWAPAVISYLELSYLLCYVTVAAGLGVLYALHLKLWVDFYWTVTLLASYLCYAALPFFQTLPPRSVGEERWAPVEPTNPVRRFNLWILSWGSIQVNTYPSAHVAASIACALALLPAAPMFGAIFLWIGISIAAGAVVGRYHYLADANTGVMVALVAFALAWALS